MLNETNNFIDLEKQLIDAAIKDWAGRDNIKFLKDEDLKMMKLFLETIDAVNELLVRQAITIDRMSSKLDDIGGMMTKIEKK